MTIHMLSAEYGDAIVIRTMAEGKPFTIVVDGGPETTAENIVPNVRKSLVARKNII